MRVIRRLLSWFGREYRVPWQWLCCLLMGGVIIETLALVLALEFLPWWVSWVVGPALSVPLACMDVAARRLQHYVMDAISGFDIGITPADMLAGPLFLLSFGVVAIFIATVAMACVSVYIAFWPFTIPFTIVWWRLRRS